MPPPPVSGGLTRSNGIHATGGAGNYGPARSGASRPRAASRTESKDGDHGGENKASPVEAKSRSRSSSIKETKPPISVASKPNLPAHDEQTTTVAPSTSSHRPPPITAPKPKLPLPPTPTQSQPPAQTPTLGSRPVDIDSPSSSAPVHAEDKGTQPDSTPLIPPSHSGPTPQSAKSSKPPLPPIPQQTGPSRSGPGPETSNGFSDFERTFPSLDDFGKRFETPSPAAPPSIPAPSDDESKYAFPEVPSTSFPDLPSVPRSLPGLPNPPSGSPPGRFSTLKAPDHGDGGHDSPPNPDVDRDTKRPSSQPNLTKLDGRIDPSITDSLGSPDHQAPTLQDFRTPQPASTPGNLSTPVLSPQTTRSSPNGTGHEATPPPIAFPTPQPTPAQRRSMPVPSRGTDDPTKSTKPKFPFSNSVNCETLRSYFLNPDVEMILLDVRPEEEYRRGVVGAEYEPRGAKLRVIWMDPTVLMRNELVNTPCADIRASADKQHHFSQAGRLLVPLARSAASSICSTAQSRSCCGLRFAIVLLAAEQSTNSVISLVEHDI
jgi:ubiquitin carboxyl-terminal hydrolase 8